MNENDVKTCDSVCEKPKVRKIGETVKFIQDEYGYIREYTEDSGVYIGKGYKIIECEITNIANIKIELEYPVRNIYEENA